MLAFVTARIPARQEFVPVITGGLLGTYTLAREFHAHSGVRSAIVPSAMNPHLKGTRLGAVFPSGNIANPERLLDALADVASRVGGRSRPLLYLPAVDHHVETGVEHREDLKAMGYLLPGNTQAQLHQAAIKENFYAACDQLGIPYPRSLMFDCEQARGAEDLEEYITTSLERLASDPDLPYPVIVKGSDGSTWANLSYPGKRKVFLAHTDRELRSILRAAVVAGYAGVLVVQRYIPGQDNQLRILTQYRDRSGAMTLNGYGEVLLEDPTPGLEGNARAVMSGANTLVADQGRALLEHFDWEGFAMFDLKVDATSGTPYFLEMNPRLGQHHFYLTLAGQNPAGTLIDDFIEGQHRSVPTEVVPALSLTVPLRRALSHATIEQSERIQQAQRRGRVANPWKYRADHRFRHRVYLAYRSLRGR